MISLSQYLTMAVEEFQFKIAKAKDLPLSWFELVLRPEKFSEHILTLEINPHVEPTALQLMVTFLEKAGCIEGQSSPEKRKTLVDCALFMASFLRWDMATFEKSLPPAIQFTLFSALSEAFPLKRDNEDQICPPPRQDAATLTAHVLYNQWVVRFLSQYDLPMSSPLTTRNDNWEITCASPEQIYKLADQMASDAVSFLTEVCNASLQLKFRLPLVSVDLPVLSGQKGEEVFHMDLPDGERRGVPMEEVTCQLWCDLGFLHFKREEFTEAHSAFSQADKILSCLSKTPPLLDRGQLNGFLLACRCLLGRGEEERDKSLSQQVEECVFGTFEEVEESEKSLSQQVEEMRIGNFEAVVDILSKDNEKRELSSAFRTAVEMDCSYSTVSMGAEPLAKRPKLDHPEIPPEERLCICNAVRDVVEGRNVRPRVWQLLSQGNRRHFEFVFQLCGRLLRQKESRLRKHEIQYLQTFVRSVCSTSRSVEVWEQLFTSEAKELALPQDSKERVSSRLGGLIKCDWRTGQSSAVSEMEREISLAQSGQELTAAVDRLFKTTPAAEHKATAAKWEGSDHGLASQDSIAAPILHTKYNALVHRAQQLRLAKSYLQCLDFLREALRLLSSQGEGGGRAVSSRARQQLEPQLKEQVLAVELLAAREDVRRNGPEGVSSGLIEKAKGYYQQSRHDSSLDPITVWITGAFLLNTLQYTYLARQDEPIPGKVSPRLAIAVLNVKEERDMRKPTRDLFEAVLGVFSPPLTSTESKSEQNEKQSKLRSYLDSFTENLLDPTGLSLLMAALARIWNILKKPEDEIVSEFNNHWPTAIGNPGNIDASHVFRTLSTALGHALALNPMRTPWILMQADVYNATEKYGAALGSYMEAWALETQHFELEVLHDVWNQKVFKRIISCCTKLGYHTHSVIFCQFLDPVDYELAFSILANHSSAAMESLFDYFWDMTIIEYLIYIHSKRGDTHKQTVAIQVAGQPELNFNNSSEVLARAVQVRKRKFLRTFYKHITS